MSNYLVLPIVTKAYNEYKYFMYIIYDPACAGGMIGWRVSANCALARTGGCLRGDVPPSEAGRFLNFEN